LLTILDASLAVTHGLARLAIANAGHKTKISAIRYAAFLVGKGAPDYAEMGDEIRMEFLRYAKYGRAINALASLPGAPCLQATLPWGRQLARTEIHLFCKRKEAPRPDKQIV
jgi:hypothetical protein